MNYAKGIAMCGAIFVASAGVATVAAPAEAKKRPVVVTGPSTDTVTRKVSYRDLNLASLPDQKILHKRVRGAVSGVCYEANGPSPEIFIQMACRDNAWRGARPQIANAVLRAQQIATTGQSLIAVSAITLTLSK